MLVTEEETKRLWCPAARFSLGTHDNNAANRWKTDDGSPGRSACIASKCMWWRWFDTLNDDGTACHLKATAMVARVPEGDQKNESPLNMRRGYCGMAGTP